MPDPAYALFALAITDEALHQDYLASAVTSLAGTGAELVFATENFDVWEGAPTVERLVLLKFPSPESAQAWYDSSAYRAARELRFASAATDYALLIKTGASSG